MLYSQNHLALIEPHLINLRTQNESLFGADFDPEGIMGTFFFENEQWEAVIVHGDCYRAMLNEFFFTKIEEKDISNIWFQQDGATCHTAEATLDVFALFLKIALSAAELMSFGQLGAAILHLWTLWDAVKVKWYADKPETTNALKDNIREAIGQIQLHIIDN